jgi:hypothetical protein
MNDAQDCREQQGDWAILAIAAWYWLTIKRSCDFVPDIGLREAGDRSEHFVDWAFAHDYEQEAAWFHEPRSDRWPHQTTSERMINHGIE